MSNSATSNRDSVQTLPVRKNPTRKARLVSNQPIPDPAPEGEPATSNQEDGPAGSFDPQSSPDVSTNSETATSSTPRTEESLTNITSGTEDETCDHEVRNETLFQEDERFHSKLDAEVEKGRDIATKINNLLAERPEAEEALLRLRETAKNLSKYQNAATKTIAVLGNSGAGKSSLINSLLNCPEIAKTGDIGSSCTSVVTEFRQKRQGQSSLIPIEVEYLSSAEIRDLLNELLWNFRKPFLETDESTVAARDLEQYEKDSEVAWSSLQAAFGHQDAFSRDFLQDQSENGFEDTLEQLVVWSQELDWPGDSAEGKWCSTTESAEECCDELEIFFSDKFWPFTKVIRIYLESEILSNGIVLADLPGLHDKNLARVRATQKYLMHCDCIFIVADISRALSDASLQSSIYKAISQLFPYEWEERAGQSFKLAVICTKSDEINVRANRREFCGENKQISKETIDMLEKEIVDAKRQGDKDAKKRLERKEKMLLRAARNRHVKVGLRAAYASKLPQRDLKVFCVSSKMYEKGVEEESQEMMNASEIPLLKRYCQSLSAKARLFDANYFLQSQLTSLLNSVEIWTNDTVSAARETGPVQATKVYSEFSKVESKILDLVSTGQSGLSNSFQEIILDCFDHRSGHWKTEAQKQAESWHSWHHTQYNAWCRNDGEHTTPRRSYVNWNAQLIWKMRMELETQWDVIDSEISKLTEGLSDSIKEEIKAFRCFCEGLELPSSFRRGLASWSRAIVHEIELTKEKLESELRKVRHKTSEANGISYILREMVAAYRPASCESGTGRFARQRSIVYGRISNGAIFPNISEHIKQDISNAWAVVFNLLIDGTNNVLECILDDLAMALSNQQRQWQASAEERREMDLFTENVASLREKHTKLCGRMSKFNGAIC